MLGYRQITRGSLVVLSYSVVVDEMGQTITLMIRRGTSSKIYYLTFDWDEVLGMGRDAGLLYTELVMYQRDQQQRQISSHRSTVVPSGQDQFDAFLRYLEQQKRNQATLTFQSAITSREVY